PFCLIAIPCTPVVKCPKSISLLIFYRKLSAQKFTLHACLYSFSNFRIVNVLCPVSIVPNEWFRFSGKLLITKNCKHISYFHLTIFPNTKLDFRCKTQNYSIKQQSPILFYLIHPIDI